jgi:hypothetical protein
MGTTITTAIVPGPSLLSPVYQSGKWWSDINSVSQRWRIKAKYIKLELNDMMKKIYS